MDNDGDKQEETRNNMSSDSEFSESFWIRFTGLQIDTINQRLLDYNAYTICVGCPILYIILCLL